MPDGGPVGLDFDTGLHREVDARSLEVLMGQLDAGLNAAIESPLHQSRLQGLDGTADLPARLVELLVDHLCLTHGQQHAIREHLPDGSNLAEAGVAQRRHVGVEAGR